MSKSGGESSGCQSYGIFWDIENCPIPTNERAANVIQSLKQFIVTKFETTIGAHQELCTFTCACDTRNLDPKHVEGLNRCGVDILHVNPVRTMFKVDADSKLMECIEKFVEHHFHKGVIFVITGDIDFAPAIRSAKRKGFEVILLFGANTSQDLKNCASESHSYYDIILNRENDSTSATNGMASDDIPMAMGSRPITNGNRSTSHPLISPVFDREPMDTRVASRQTILNPSEANHSTKTRSESQDRSGARVTDQSNQNSSQSTTEFDPKKLRTVMEITGVERHIALRMLQICNGNVELAINAVFSD